MRTRFSVKRKQKRRRKPKSKNRTRPHSTKCQTNYLIVRVLLWWTCGRTYSRSPSSCFLRSLACTFCFSIQGWECLACGGNVSPNHTIMKQRILFKREIAHGRRLNAQTNVMIWSRWHFHFYACVCKMLEIRSIVLH